MVWEEGAPRAPLACRSVYPASAHILFARGLRALTWVNDSELPKAGDRETNHPSSVLVEGSTTRLSAWGRLNKGKARMAFAFPDGENKSHFYKTRAQEFRALAENAIQSQSRDTFLGLARTYERVAQLAAEREAREAIAGNGEAGPRTPQGRRSTRMDPVDRRSPLRQIDMSCPRCRRHMRPTLEQLAVAGHIPCPCCGLEVGLDGARYRSLVARFKLSTSGGDPRDQQNGRHRRSLR